MPRSIDSQFLKDVSALDGISAKKMIDSPIVYGAVVQAHSALWEPGNNSNTGVVVVFALDTEHIYNIEWLTKMADKISDLKETLDIPKDSRKFINTLKDSQSYFVFKLGDSINEGADAWCVTYALKKQNYLPKGYIPANHIIPFILEDYPKEDLHVGLNIIPESYYTK